VGELSTRQVDEVGLALVETFQEKP
jgi:hypothetical protein